MNRFTFKWMALAGAMLVPAVSYAQISCTREGLKAAVDLYVAAQTKGDTAAVCRWRWGWVTSRTLRPLASTRA